MKRLFRFFLRVTRLSSFYDSKAEILRWVWNIFRGASEFWRSGVTPEEAYHSMILLYCRTQGRSNDVMHSVVKRANPTYRLSHPKGVLGDFGRGDARRMADAVREKGYHVFKRPLPPEIVEEIVRYARRAPCIPVPKLAKGPSSVIYDSSAPIAPRYDFPEGDLLVAEPIQKLVTDLSLLAVAQEYLGCAPILDIVTMWWSTAFQKEASDIAGQRYHFDMDRIKWLKFFFYLTDVTPESGPTCFVEGSHRTLVPPRELLSHGYSRISDEDMLKHFPPQKLIELTCPKGSIVAVDTRGFHKGKPLESGDRLVLQIEFADSLFGAAYQRHAVRLTEDSPLAFMARKYPRIYSKYDWVS
jgi:hypothetical protein